MCKKKKEKIGIEETTEEASKKNEELESKIQGTYNGVGLFATKAKNSSTGEYSCAMNLCIYRVSILKEWVGGLVSQA